MKKIILNIPLIEEKMNEAGWSLSKLARQINISPAALSYLMNFHSDPRIYTIEKLGDALDCNPLGLLEEINRD